MGGRGTFASGNKVAYTYRTVDIIEGVKVLKGLNGKHGLPEEAHSSKAYIQTKDGVFRSMRIYDDDGYLVLEIAHHREAKLNKQAKAVLHYHTYDRKFNRSKAAYLTDDM